MATPIERAKAHFKDRLSDVRIIEVPEWGEDGVPLKVYVKPMNLLAQQRIFKLANDGSLEALVETLIIRARTEDEMKLFRSSDKDDLLRKVDPAVIARVANEINDDLSVDDDDLDDAAKNLTRTATS